MKKKTNKKKHLDDHYKVATLRSHIILFFINFIQLSEVQHMYLICIAPNPSMFLNFSCLKVTLLSSTESRLFLSLHLEMIMSSLCQRLLGEPFLLLTLRKGKPLALLVACANVYSGYNAMARQDAFVQPYQFDPEWDPEGEAPEEEQTLAAAGHFRMVSVSE